MANSRQAGRGRFGKRIKFSIVLKLNAHFIFRLFLIFAAVDVLLCAAFSAAAAFYAEQAVGAVAEKIEEIGAPSEDASVWLGCTEYKIEQLPGGMQGYTVPVILRGVLPKFTASAIRSVTMGSAENSSFWSRLDGLAFSVETEYGGTQYAITLSLGFIVLIFKRIFCVLAAFEFLTLITGIFSGLKLIRKTLSPIAELAETARNINEGEGGFSPEEMEALAGKLNGINAERLDTRISIDSTQDELKALAASINGMLGRINEAYSSQVRFVSDASHELRTPISVIQGYANLLDRWGKNDPKTMQESIDAIKEETANMKLLVEQLLFLARGDNNTMALHMERFDFSRLALEVLHETQMIDAGHEYASRLEKVSIYADYALVKQAVRILTDNAIKYTPAGGHITISVYHEGAYARLCVQDEGIGIPPRAVPKIFDRFYRADESRARATGGTGLGLSIAKWIVERHGGHLEVLSRENIGTRISIVLPASNDGTNQGAQTEGK